jgi:penicillin-binding protein 1A
MEAILIKVFATALALSQVMTRPDTVKTQFDPTQDQAEVVQLLGDGCTYLRKAFDIENIDLDDLIQTAMTDKTAVEGEVKAFRGLKFSDLHVAYREICKKERVERSVVDVPQVIEFYNQALANLPDHNQLKGLKLPGLTTVLDSKGTKYAELFEPDHRRLWVPLSDIPKSVQQAFIAAEDKRFFEHHGVDERSVIRAFINTVADPKQRQGGSTITQQVVKNLLVGNDISYERKMREMVVAGRLERALTKQEILEAYLNAIYLGRGAWGIEMAARSYFGKPAKALTLTESAFLAGIAKGPNFYNPDRHRERAHERLAYVLGRMQEDGVIDTSQMNEATGQRLAVIANVRPRRESGFHIVDQMSREAKAVAGIGSLTSTSYSVRSTIQPQVQWAAEAAVQEGLARYEASTGRARFAAPEANLTDAIRRIQANPTADRSKPAWLQAL